MAGRQKRPLGDVFGLANFGVNLTWLAPGAVSDVKHLSVVLDARTGRFVRGVYTR